MKSKLLLGVFVASTAFASTIFLSGAGINGHVVQIETSYMPKQLNFKLDTGATGTGYTCPAGTWLIVKQPTQVLGVTLDANEKAEYMRAALTVFSTSMLSGKTAYVAIDTTNVGSLGAGTCVVTWTGIVN